MAQSLTSALGWLFCGWLAYGALHSLLASFRIKTWVTRRWPACAPYYRLAYNLVATLLLLPLLWATFTLPGEPLWRWSSLAVWLANGLAVAALAGVWYVSRSYDMDEFLGVRALRERRSAAAECDALRISPLHRHVRHPWYSLGLVLIWTREMNAPLLVSALAVTLYLIVGARLEEQKLLARFGARYRAYMQRVPGLVPLPWKHLSAAEAAALEEGSMERARHCQHEF